MRISIRHKILGVLGALLVLAIGCYTVLASFIFIEQKRALLFDLNHSIAINTAGQLQSSFNEIRDQLQVFTLSQILTQGSPLSIPPDFLNNTQITGLQIYRKRSFGYSRFSLPNSIKTFEDPSVSDQLAKVESLHIWPDPKNIKRFFVATKIPILFGDTTREFVAVGEIKMDGIFHTLLSNSIFRSYLLNKQGKVLASVNDGELQPSEPIPNHPLLARSKAQKSSGVATFELGEDTWHGAYAPILGGELYFFSQAHQNEVTSAIVTLIKRSLLFGLIVLTLTFIASVLFSKKLTENLRKLLRGINRTEQGDLDTKITIRSTDEIHDLADSFNAMIGALRRSRAEIEKHNRELEQKVADRTKDLEKSNATIKEVQEKLLKNTQMAAVGEVAGRTAHELLNPMTAIVTRVERLTKIAKPLPNQESLPKQLTVIIEAWENELKSRGIDGLLEDLNKPSSVLPGKTLLEEDLENLKVLTQLWNQQNQTLSEDLTFVQEQTARIHRTIGKMREFVRSSAKQTVNCHQAVNEALSTLADFLKEHRIQLQSELKAEQDEAEANPDEIIQLITNLIRNAFQAIEAREDNGPPGRIEVKTSNNQQAFIVDVIDNGIGIEPSIQTKIFDAGFTTKPTTEGTGLGLAICRRYAHAFNGEVELVSSEKGRGSWFRLTIPLQQSARRAS